MNSKRDLNESYNYSHTILWNPISKGLKNLKQAFKLGLKDIWGSIRYAYKITIATDEKRIEELKRNRNDALNKLSEEYKQLWENVVETNEDFSTFAMLAAPGPYLAAYFTLNGRANLQSVQQYCKNAGISTKTLEKFLGNPAESPDDIEYIKRMMLRRNTSGSQKADIEETLNDVLKKITKIMRIKDESINEYAGIQAIRNKLSEKSDNKGIDDASSPSDELLKGYIKLFQSEEFAKAIEKKINSRNILKAKQDELEAYVKALEAPIRFIDLVEASSNLQEVAEAYKVLTHSVLKIEGLDSTDPAKKIQIIVDETYQKIKNDNKAKDAFIKGAEIKPNTNVKEQYAEEYVKAAITKVVSIKQLEQIKQVVSSEETQKSLEIAREEFIKNFKAGLDDKLLNSMKKIDSTFPDLIESGVEKIRNAGLLKK